MDIDNTSLCFVTAHLAAGFANYDERNRDYKTINYGLRFQRGRSIDAHDTVIWLGDFNYRIGLAHERAVKLAKTGDFETLYEHDQLNLQMVAGLTFPYYSEARILFAPTYKYDVNTDDYDTSEKARIPAWCDRVLRKGTNLRQINYDAAPLKFSDHRPVYATFLCKISIIDEKTKATLSEELYQKRREVVAGATANAKNDDSEAEDLLGYESIEPGLPPASSDRRRWWLDNGLPARSTLQAPSKDLVPNPNRPSNPWTPSEQPDWITGSSPTAVKAPALLPSRDNSLRKVPTPSINAARMAIRNVSNGASAPISPARKVSTSSVQSTGSNDQRKAPPVPRKPPSLTSSNGAALSSTNREIVKPSQTFPIPGATPATPIWRVPLGGRKFSPTSSTAASVRTDSTTNSPAPVRSSQTFPIRNAGGTSLSRTPTKSTGNLLDDVAPRPFPRTGTGLMDSDEGGMSGWAPLKPS